VNKSFSHQGKNTLFCGYFVTSETLQYSRVQRAEREKTREKWSETSNWIYANRNRTQQISGLKPCNL